MKKGFLIILLGLSFFLLRSQTCPNYQDAWTWKTHQNWYTGDRKIISFAGSPTITSTVNTGKLAYESTAAASDDNGKLLFYTDGESVYLPDGSYMPGGNTTLKVGNENGATAGSAVQGVMIVKHPLNITDYYIFTTDDGLSGTKGYNYAIVDISTNGGKGSVVAQKRLGSYRTCEKQQAIWHNNKTDIWILTQESGTGNLNAYLLKCSGLEETPVVSASGMSGSGETIERGALAISWDGKRAALFQGVPRAYLLDFDDKTGQFSNPLNVGGPMANVSGYDCAFSADGSKVYVTLNPNGIAVYDVSSWGNKTAIESSYKTVSGTPGVMLQLKLGPDGVMYVGMRNPGNIGAITGNINSASGLGYNANAVANPSSLGGFVLSMPKMFIPPQDKLDIQEVGPYTVCDDTVDLIVKWACKGNSAEDPVVRPTGWTGIGITDQANGIFDPNIAGVGTWKIKYSICDIYDSIFIVVKDCSTCPDTSLKNSGPICVGENINLNTMKITIKAGTWSIQSSPTGANPAFINGTTFNASGLNSTPGSYVLRYTLSPEPSLLTCPKYAERTIVVNPKPSVDAGPDQSICTGGTAILDAGVGFITYNWSPNGQNTQSIAVNTSGTFIVSVSNNFGCKQSDTVGVSVNPNLTIDLGPDKIICEGQVVTFTTNYSGNGVTYDWTGGESTKSITVSTSGTYHVHVMDPSGCEGADDVVLTVNPLPTPAVADATICEGQTQSFDAGAYSAYVWSGPANYNSISNPISVSKAGTYVVTVTDANACKNSDSTTLVVHPNPIVNLGSDYYGCAGTSTTFDAGNAGAIFLWSNASSSQSVFVTNDGSFSVIVTDTNNCKGYDTAKAVFMSVPVLEIGPDIDLCSGESAQVIASVSPSSSIVTWNGGTANTTTYPVSSGGKVYASAQNGGICSANDSLEVFIHASPKVLGMKDSIVCFLTLPDGLLLDARTSAAQYNWSDGQSGRSITVNKEGKYTVDLISDYGCKSSDAITITEDCPSSIFTPNAFTPNEDGTNDVFYVRGENIYDFELYVFDRWGEVIYHSTDMNEGWNGKKYNDMRDAQIDVYVWKISYKHWSDWKRGSNKRQQVGKVSLIR